MKNNRFFRSVILAVVSSSLIAFSCSNPKSSELKAGLNLSANDIYEFVEYFVINQLNNGKEPLHVDVKDSEKLIYMDTTSEYYSKFSIPLNKEGVLRGDLNSDGKKDIIVVVKQYSSAGIFKTINLLFVCDNNSNYSFIKKIDSSELTSCNADGDLPGECRLELITDNKLIGTLNCYTGNRAKCCPIKFRVAFTIAPDTYKINLINQVEKN